MFSQFYGLPNREGWRRVDELIEITGLTEQRDQKVRTLSTGQRQKLNFARGMLNDPWVLFLDEPTLGLDVAAARDLREHTLAWKAAAPARTVLLTTHYMVEAEQLCDRIAIVDRGKILALGTPEELRRRVQAESIFRIELDRLPQNGGIAAIGDLPGVLSAVRADEEMADAARLGPRGAQGRARRRLGADQRGHRGRRARLEPRRPRQVGAVAWRTSSSSSSAADSATRTASKEPAS